MCSPTEKNCSRQLRDRDWQQHREENEDLFIERLKLAFMLIEENLQEVYR